MIEPLIVTEIEMIEMIESDPCIEIEIEPMIVMMIGTEIGTKIETSSQILSCQLMKLIHQHK
jgi:hypothetical protein